MEDVKEEVTDSVEEIIGTFLPHDLTLQDIIMKKWIIGLKNTGVDDEQDVNHTI